MRLDLEKIQIENFYSYKNIIYDNFKDYNVIIGKNNSGKSNLFKLFNLLKRNSFDNDIQLTDLFDEDFDLEQKVTLVFNIDKILRTDIFSILYDRNYLSKMFEYYLRFPNKHKDYQPYPDWKNKKDTLEWLLNRDIFNKLSIEIKYNKEKKYLILKKISVYHSLSNNFQILFELQDDRKKEEPFVMKI